MSTNSNIHKTYKHNGRNAHIRDIGARVIIVEINIAFSHIEQICIYKKFSM